MPKILVESAVTTGIVGLLLGMAAVFGWVLTTLQIPLKLANRILAIADSRWVFLILVNPGTRRLGLLPPLRLTVPRGRATQLSAVGYPGRSPGWSLRWAHSRDAGAGESQPPLPPLVRRTSSRPESGQPPLDGGQASDRNRLQGLAA